VRLVWSERVVITYGKWRVRRSRSMSSCCGELILALYGECRGCCSRAVKSKGVQTTFLLVTFDLLASRAEFYLRGINGETQE